MMAQMLRFLPHICETWSKFWLWPGHALAIATIVELNQQVKDVFLTSPLHLPKTTLPSRLNKYLWGKTAIDNSKGSGIWQTSRKCFQGKKCVFCSWESGRPLWWNKPESLEVSYHLTPWSANSKWVSHELKLFEGQYRIREITRNRIVYRWERNWGEIYDSMKANKVLSSPMSHWTCHKGSKCPCRILLVVPEAKTSSPCQNWGKWLIPPTR